MGIDYGLEGKVAVVTGAGGAICGEIARGLGAQGAVVAVWDIKPDAAERTAESIRSTGAHAVAVQCEATNASSVESAMAETLSGVGEVDILVNGAGGSRRETTTSPELTFFQIPAEAMQATFALNYLSAVIPSQIVGRLFAENESGVVLNISSVAGILPLTRAISYSDAKAAVSSFTRWLAVHMAQTYAPDIRVNAVAPGFILTDQNRFLLVDETSGEATERGRQILEQVPARRYGNPQEIVGAALWLVSDSASFVTGAVVPVDGGFSAFSGV